jgi:putative transposase
VKRMIQKRNLSRGQKRRVLGKKTCRKLAQMSHGRFREFLLHKAQEYGTKIIICDEYWTSKTCTSCGKIKEDLGSAKVFSCACGSTHGRDAGAARNILLRYIATRVKFLQNRARAQAEAVTPMAIDPVVDGQLVHASKT